MQDQELPKNKKKKWRKITIDFEKDKKGQKLDKKAFKNNNLYYKPKKAKNSASLLLKKKKKEMSV